MTDNETFPVVGTKFAILPCWVMELGVNQAMVYAALATFTNTDHHCWPKMESIALRAHVSTRTARVAIRALEDAGAIETLTRRRADGGNASNGYVIYADPPAGRAAPPRQDVPEAPAGRAAQELEPRELEGVEGEGPSSSMTLAAPASAGAHESAGWREAGRLCCELADAIEANGCRRPSVTKAWLDDARLLVDKDGIDPEDVVDAIRWATNHSFWRANILSMPTLRRQYDKLRLQAQRDRENGKSIGERRYDEAQDSLRVAMQRVEAGGAL